MNNNKSISIIIPCYNAGIYILDTVLSILAQPFKCIYEIIIVDDGSNTPETLEALQSIELLDKNIRIIYNTKNCGSQYARNIAIKESKYDYIFNIDADDCLNTNIEVLKEGTYADIAINILSTREDIAFVHGTTLMFGEYNGLTSSAYPLSEEMLLNKHHASNSIVYRKQDAIAAKLYNQSILKWQDWSFAVAILNYRFKVRKKNNIFFLNKPYYLYRIHQNTQRISSSDINELEMIYITVCLYSEIFKNKYPFINNKEIAQKVYLYKPNELKNLLYVANNSIQNALDMVNSKSFELISTMKLDNIP